MSMLKSHWTLFFAVCLCSNALVGCAVGADGSEEGASAEVGEPELQTADDHDHGHHGGGDDHGGGGDCDNIPEINAKGAFTCDFRIAGDFPPQDLPGRIEADRMIMAAGQINMLHKQIPVSFDPTFTTNGAPDFDSGGRYLYDTVAHAKFYHNFVNNLVIDGVSFLGRPYFFAPECHDWSVLHAVDLKPIHTNQVIIRTERFSVPNHANGTLESKWHDILSEAVDNDYASVWLLYNDDEDLASLVYTIDRVDPKDPNVPDFASLGALQSETPLGHFFDSSSGFTRTLDRTSWILTVWYPYKDRDRGLESDWPDSPPFPEPFCGDGTCEPSRGETHATCAADCEPHCGDGVCQTQSGEDDVNCPSDCGEEVNRHDGGGGCDH